MADASRILQAEHHEHGKLYAAVDPAARYVTSKVSEMRFAALLTPFKSVVEAEAALVLAGVHVPDGGAL